MLAIIPILGGAGQTEVELRLAASEAFAAAGDPERVHSALRQTLHQVQLRADDISDAFWRTSYLTRNPYITGTRYLIHKVGAFAEAASAARPSTGKSVRTPQRCAADRCPWFRSQGDLQPDKIAGQLARR